MHGGGSLAEEDANPRGGGLGLDFSLYFSFWRYYTYISKLFVCKGLKDKLWHQVNLRVSHRQLVVFCHCLWLECCLEVMGASRQGLSEDLLGVGKDGKITLPVFGRGLLSVQEHVSISTQTHKYTADTQRSLCSPHTPVEMEHVYKER